MADNSLQNGTDIISTDVITTLNGASIITGEKAQRMKMGFGTDSSLRDIDAANPMPTQQTDGVTKQSMRPDGFAKAFIDPTTLQFDTFETLNLTDSWTAGGTSPTVSSGVLVIAAGTAANAMSYTFSKAAFTPGSNAFLNVADLVTLQAAVITGAKCVWGLGVIAGSPTAAVPLSNGAVFEILDTDGALYGAVYSNGVRTQSVALTRPTDAAIHRYAIYYKASRAYFEIDGVQVGSIAFPNPTVASLANVIGTFNGAAVLTTAPTLTSSLMGVADTGRNNTKISDGLFPWRMQTVKAPSTAAVATDLPAVVALHPSSPVPLPVITKGTQGTNGVTTQALKDSGRARIAITFMGAAAAVADTLLSLVKVVNGTPAAGATSIGATTGKTLSISSITFSLKSAAAAAAFATLTLRTTPSGATTITSGIEARIDAGNTAAAIGAADKVELIFPDGMEFSGAQTLGLSLAAQAIGNIASISINGFEY